MTDCAICLHLLRIPVKVLMCGHSFCLPCLRQLRRQSGPWFPGRRMKLACPSCRQETPLHNGRVHELPTNYALNELLELERQNEGENDQLQLQSVRQADGDAPTSSYYFNSISNPDEVGRRNRQNVISSNNFTSTEANTIDRRNPYLRGIGDVLQNWGVQSSDTSTIIQATDITAATTDLTSSEIFENILVSNIDESDLTVSFSDDDDDEVQEDNLAMTATTSCSDLSIFHSETHQSISDICSRSSSDIDEYQSSADFSIGVSLTPNSILTSISESYDEESSLTSLNSSSISSSISSSYSSSYY